MKTIDRLCTSYGATKNICIKGGNKCYTIDKVCNLAAANPKAGRFQSVSEVPFTQQINLKPALISRFDVIWLLTDQPQADHDSMIANHIMNNRASSTPEILIEKGSEVDPSKSAKHDGVDKKEGIVNRELIRKYVAFAKRSIHPKLTDEAQESLREFYVETRRKEENLTIQSLFLQEQLKDCIVSLKPQLEFDYQKLQLLRMPKDPFVLQDSGDTN